MSLPAALACALLAAAPLAQDPEIATDAQARAAWAKLGPAEKEEVVEWFRSEVVYLPTFQQGLIDFVLASAETDPGLWPEDGAAPWYDPAMHAPAQPIARKPLAADSKALAKKREEFFFRVPKRRLDSGWRYDWASGELRRTQALDDLDRVFENALRGFPPNLDLAEALVERALDGGGERAALTAFAHAYTDRSGNVFPGLSLYDAWASGADMEMPDVDVLGVYHDLSGDWKTYVAPVPDTKHRVLYDKVGAYFTAAHRYAGLRRAMARCYLTGDPVLRDGYGPNLERLHALWDECESRPAALAERLPDAKGWERFLEAWVKKVDKSPALAAKGVARRDTLMRDALWVRKKLLEVMVQAGYLKP